jgi:uncharacterized protein (DUF1778 family)
MARASTDQNQLHSVHLRVRGDTLSRIDRAAQIQGRSRSDFMIEAARRAAEQTVLDRTVISVDRDSFDCFVAMLDCPPESSEKLRNMLRAPTVWQPKQKR